MRFVRTCFRSPVAEGTCTSADSAAVRRDVMRIDFAWKKDHRLAASMLRLSASVWALLPRVSENASSVASIEMSNATFLLAGSRCAAPDVVPLFVELRRALFYSNAFLDGTSFAAS